MVSTEARDNPQAKFTRGSNRNLPIDPSKLNQKLSEGSDPWRSDPNMAALETPVVQATPIDSEASTILSTAPATNTEDKNSRDDPTKQRLHRLLSAKPDGDTLPDWRADFKKPNDPREIPKWLKYHSNCDVTTPQGLKDWHELLFSNRMIRHQPMISSYLASKTRSLPKKAADEIRRVESETVKDHLSRDIEFVDREDTSALDIEVQRSYSGASLQLGPFVADSRLLLGMKPVKKHRGTSLDLSEARYLSNCKVLFLDSQITAAAWLLQKGSTSFPVPNEVRKLPGYAEAASRLARSVPTTGSGVLGDGTGTGKTLAVLLALATSIKKLKETNDNNHRPHMITCPGGPVLEQWVTEITTFISSLEMQNPETSWPAHLAYVFDTSDPKASETIIISPFDTHSRRSLKVNPEIWGAAKPKKTNKRQKRKPTARQTWISVWKNKYHTCIVDEGHKLRHTNTKFFESIRQLNPIRCWLVTATMVINESIDAVSIGRILWITAESILAADAEASDWAGKHPGYECWEEASQFSDARRLVCMDPRRLKKLLQTGDVTEVAKYKRHFDDLVMIRRTTQSTLPGSHDGSLADVPLDEMMVPHTVSTMDLQYREDEMVEAQFWHLLYAREYTQYVANSVPAEGGSSSDTTFVPATGALRRLCVTGASTQLARLDKTLGDLGHDSLVNNIHKYRVAGYGLGWVINLVRQPHETRPQTRIDEIAFMIHGCPIGRYILDEIHTYVLGDPSNSQKLLITEDTTLVAWFWEILLKATYVGAAVMHSGLSNKARQSLVNEFNDEKSCLLVLIIMYRVGCQGINLDRACNRVLVAVPAINAGGEIQAWGRVCRVSQTRAVNIVRAKVNNSHAQWRDFRQLDKSILDLAGKITTIATRELLVGLLNLRNDEVKRVHELAREISISDVDITAEDGVIQPACSGPELDSQILDEAALKTPNMDTDIRSARIDSKRRRSIERSNAGDYESEEETRWTNIKSNWPKRSKKMSPASGQDEDFVFEERSKDSVNEEDNGCELSSDMDVSEQFDNDYYHPEDNEEESDEGTTLDNGTSIGSTTLYAARKNYRSLPIGEKEEFSQETMNVQLLLTLNPDTVYRLEDLDKKPVLERALRLLARARLGIKKEDLRVCPHIEYNRLDPAITKKHIQEMKVTEEQLVAKAIKANLAFAKTKR